jgi:GTP-binding protein
VKRLPVVSIVGRPNVGKSSLFNRLVGEKLAIIDDTPGITRDRITREANLGDIRVVLVDTGGVVPDATGMEKLVTEQAKRAIEEADVLVFVVDAKEGITPLDLEVARILRKQKKPVIVAVNKVDEPYQENLVYDFYSLGFDNVIPISAIHKIGIPTLIEEIEKHLPENLKEIAKKEAKKVAKREKVMSAISGEDEKELEIMREKASKNEDYIEEEAEEEPIKVAIVGRPNMGKSTLLNALVGEERAIVSEIPGTTRDAIDSYVKIGDTEFIFIDTAGIRRRGKIKDVEYYSYLRALSAIDRADVVVLLMDALERPTDRDAKVAGIGLEKFKPIVLAVNKIDLLKSQKDWELLHKDLDLVFDFIPYAPRVFISAKEKKGLDELLKQIKSLYEQYSKRITTGVFNRTLQKIMEVHQPPVYRNKVVKIYYGTQVAIKPPTFVLFSNYPEGIPNSFKRFLENRFRESLGFTKIPLRLVFKKR